MCKKKVKVSVLQKKELIESKKKMTDTVNYIKALRQAGLPIHGSRGQCLQRLAVANKSKGVLKKSMHSKQSRPKERVVKVKFNVGNDPAC